MKIIYLIVNVSQLDIILETIKQIGLKDYQVSEQVLSSSSDADPRMNTSVWPGYSSGVLIQCSDDEQKQHLFSEIQKHNTECINQDKRIKAFSWNADHEFIV